MRAAFWIVLAIAIASVAASEIDSDADVEFATLPGLGSECLRMTADGQIPERQRHYDGHGREILLDSTIAARSTDVFAGRCALATTCSADRQVEGACAGMGVVCCKNDASVEYPPKPVRKGVVEAEEVAKLYDFPRYPWNNAAAVPVSFDATANREIPGAAPGSLILHATANPCTSAGGVCGDVSACRGTVLRGKCSGPASTVCCVPQAGTPTPAPSTPTPAPSGGASVSMTQLIRIPAGINRGVSTPSASFQTSMIGKPGCPLTTACFSCNCRITNSIILRNQVTRQIAPNVKVTALKPFVDALERALNAAKAAGASNPSILNAYNSVRTAGALCCRPIKHSDGSAGAGWSNHSWGMAVDFYFGPNIDPRGDGKTQQGLALLAPFFNNEKLFWAAGYRGSEEDAMHFEASVEVIKTWKAQGLLK